MQDAGYDDLLPKQVKERTKVKGNDAYDLYEYIHAIENLFQLGELDYTDNRDEEETGMDAEFAKDESDVEVKEKEVDKEVTMKTDIDTGSESNALENRVLKRWTHMWKLRMNQVWNYQCMKKQPRKLT